MAYCADARPTLDVQDPQKLELDTVGDPVLARPEAAGRHVSSPSHRPLIRAAYRAAYVVRAAGRRGAGAPPAAARL